MLIKFVKAFQT